MRYSAVLLAPKVPDDSFLSRLRKESLQNLLAIIGFIDSLVQKVRTDYTLLTDCTPYCESYLVKWFTHNDLGFLCTPVSKILFIDIAVEVNVTLICEPDLFGVGFFVFNHLNPFIRKVQSSLNIEWL